MNYFEAEQAVKRAATTAYILLVITSIKLLFLYASKSPESLAYFNDLSFFVDIFVALICAVMIKRYSRTAAILLLLLYLFSIFSQLLMKPQLLQSGAIVFLAFIASIIVYFYVNGIRGTFAYHRLKKQENHDYKPAAKWTYYTGIPVAIIMVLLVTVGVLSETGGLLPTRVVSGQELADDYKNTLIKERLLKPNEILELFYSSGVFSIVENGNMITNTRVISYQMVEDTLDVYTAQYEDIVRVKIVQSGDYLTDSVIQVDTNNSGLYLLVSPEEQGDQRFVDAIISKSDLNSDGDLQKIPQPQGLKAKL